MNAALKTLGLSFRDIWQELWTILIVHLLFLFGIILIIPGPPVLLALFFYGNKIAHGETADERDFIQAVRKYWRAAWRWGSINLFVIGLLIGDYFLTGKMTNHADTTYYIQGFYVTLLISWLLLQLFVLPFLFEQKQPAVFQALRNATIFIGRNLMFVLALALLMILSLTVGMLAFMLTFVFGAAFMAFLGNHAVLEGIADHGTP